ncbi:MAG: SMP-30/gluconolactonase/LRE family protein [Gemmatimonadales bacterium]|nr:SMP-30/gluconolactonase/LRE family protein [Gemmatimonadales bacterium]
MKRTTAGLAITLAILTACQKREQSAAAASDSAMSVVDSFKTPESVLYDSAADVYLVSNINGSPLAQDDNGFIARVSPEGRVVALHWIDGASDSVTLNAPKGMAIKGDTLFVADIDAVRLFDLGTGRQLGSRAVRGATFLNDIAVGPDGTVYFTDSGLKAGTSGFASSGTDAVYRFDASGNAVAIIRGDSLGRPNGIVVDGSGAFVVTSGTGEAYHLDANGRRSSFPKPPHGQLDGIVQVPGGPFYVSSWEDSSVMSVTPPNDTYMMTVHGVASPADIGYDSRRHRLLIPSFLGNRIEIRPLPIMEGAETMRR